MALIKCPECGKEVSDKAQNCPNCAYPLQSTKDDSIVKIKLLINPPFGTGTGTVRIFDMDSGNQLWEGKDLTVARLNLSKPTTIGFAWGILGKRPPKATGMQAKNFIFNIDPSVCNKYQYKIKVGGIGRFALSEIEVIDSD